MFRAMSRLVGVVVLCGALYMLPGCGDLTAEEQAGLLNVVRQLPSLEELAPESFAGTDDSVFVLARLDPPDGISILNPGPIDVGAGPQGDTDIVAVNAETLAVEPLVSDLPTAPYGLQSDGRWVLWTEYEAALVRAFDRRSGKTINVLNLDSDAGSQAQLVDGRAIVVALRESRTDITVVTLATRERQIIHVDDGDGDGSAVGVVQAGLWNDQLLMLSTRYPAFPDEGTGDPAALPPGSGADGAAWAPTVRLESIDLASGERVVLVDSLDGEALYENALKVEGDRAVFALNDPASGDALLYGYDLQAGEIHTLRRVRGSDNSYGRISDFRDGSVLVARSETSADSFRMTHTVSLIDDGGHTRVLATYAATLDHIAFYQPSPKFVGDHAVWQDAFSGDWVVYDLTADSQRTVEPF